MSVQADKLTWHQKEALKILGTVDRPCPTSTCTSLYSTAQLHPDGHITILGGTAKSLERRGLVTVRMNERYAIVVTLTELGRKMASALINQQDYERAQAADRSGS